MKKQLLRITKNLPTYYKDETTVLIHGDSLELLKKIPPQSIDMIFADPPYFLSDGGVTCVSGKMVSVNKAKWDEAISVKDKHKFNKQWIRACKKVLKDDGTIWISGTMHNIYSVGLALEELGFKIINNITWQKSNPPPNISCRAFTHSTETILWAKKDIKHAKHKFNYQVMKQMNDNKQMKDVWRTSLTKPSEKKQGRHPTQKPISVLHNIIISSTDEGDVILDPFNGSGTTGVVAKQLNRNYIGIDKEEEYLELSIRRIDNEETVRPNN